MENYHSLIYSSATPLVWDGWFMKIRSYIAFPRPLEEEPDDQDLQSRHPNHHPYFDQTEIEDSLFRTPDRAEVPVLSCTEVFLHAADRAELATDFEDRVF